MDTDVLVLLGLAAIFFHPFYCSISASATTTVTTTTTTTSSTTMLLLPLASEETDPREICATGKFSPSCAPGSVVMVTEAKYGRMKEGGCVKTNYGFIGCGADVLDYLDDVCSGRKSCSVSVPDKRLEDANVCPSEFKAYLNVSYECIPVEESACDSCRPHVKSRVAKIIQPNGFISSLMTLDPAFNACGSVQCPWFIEVQSGQTINLTLYDFSNKSLTQSTVSVGQCGRLAVIKEDTHLKETPICYQQQQRVQKIYSSVSNAVQIHVVSPEVLKTKGQFLIYYEAVGCPDIQAPERAWLERHGDRIVVGCQDTTPALTSEIRCVDTKWEGEIETCPGHSSQPQSTSGVMTLPLGVLVAIVLGIALVIGVLIVTLGVICLKRQQNVLLTRSGDVLYVPASQCYELREDYTLGHSSTSGRKATHTPEHSSATAKHKARLAAEGRRNVYAHTQMETRPLPSLPNLSDASSLDLGGSRGGGAVAGHCGPGEPCLCHPPRFPGRTSSQSCSHGSGSAGQKQQSRTTPGASSLKCKIEQPQQSLVGVVLPLVCPACDVAQPPPAHCSTSASSPQSAVPQHYTVLDPIEVMQLIGTTTPSSLQGGHFSGHAGAPVGGAAVPPPKPPHQPALASTSAGQAAKPSKAAPETSSRLLGNEGIQQKTSKEITLRPTRQKSTAQSKRDNKDSSASSGNSSWP